MNKKEEKVSLPLFGIPKLLPYMKPYRWLIFWMFVLGVISSIIDTVYPLFNRYALNHFVGEGTLDTLPVFTVLFILVLVFQVIDNYVNVYLCGKVEMYIDRDLRNTAFGHLQTLSFSYFNQNSVGYVHARVMSDTEKIGALVAWRMMDVVWHGTYIISALVIMLTIDARLAGYILLLIPIAAAAILYFQKHLIVLNRQVREMNAQITGDFNEEITGARTIKTLVVEEKLKKEFGKDTEKMRRTSVHAAHFSALFSSSVTLMSAMALAIVLWKGGQISAAGLMEIGTLAVFVSYALGILDPLQNLINTIANMIAIQVNIERYDRLVHTQSDVKDTKEVIEKYGDSFDPRRENWEPLKGDIEFEDVSFRYPDGEELVLEHFNLKVPQGMNVAIVGETGAGKSTLVNLVCRFYEPTSGRVLIDGKDARERSQLWLHSNIGYVLQTPHLFSGTVRDNLRYGNPSAADEEIWEALRLVSGDFVVKKMDKGLDSEVGEDGSMLSTGEKQLLSFARAILADPKILVLDEATSSIDTVTERMIQDAIHTVIAGRTSFVIAHRLSTIVDADVILVVKDGKLIERGRHEELMRQKGYYYELYTRQFEELAADMVGEEPVSEKMPKGAKRRRKP